MKMRLSTSSRLMCCGIVISLGWFIFESCECDTTKEQDFPGFWVSCIGNQPTLMTYSGDTPVLVTSTAAGRFDPSRWDCTNPSSPNYKQSQTAKPETPPFSTSGPTGPVPGIRPHLDATGPGTAYIPQQLRDLPFTAPVPRSSPTCDSTFPDVLRAIHTEAIVTRISTCPFQIKATIPVVTRPLQVAITPDGSYALVTSFDNAVNFINLSTNKVTFTLMTDQSVNPHGLAISNDATRAYITSFVPDLPQVLVIDISNLNAPKVIANIPLPTTLIYPQGATLTPDNSQLWITSPLATAVGVIDTLSNTLSTTLSIPESVDVAFNNNGTTAYITSQNSTPGTVYAVATDTYQVVKQYAVGATPTDIQMSYGNQFLVVNNSGDGSVSVIDLVQNAVKTNKSFGNFANPSGIAWVH